jgi:PleD family two-component response regulator
VNPLFNWHSLADKEEDMESKKVLLVSTEACKDVEESLNHTDCEVITVRDGAAAVACAKHVTIDAAILVSAGRVMDRAETALNLRDINPMVEIIIIASHRGRSRNPPLSELVAGAIPNTRVLTPQDLDHYLASPTWRGTGTER